MTQTAFSNNPADGFSSSSSSSRQRSRFYSSSSAIGITYVQTEQQQTDSSIVSCKSQPGGSFGSRCTKESQGIVTNSLKTQEWPKTLENHKLTHIPKKKKKPPTGYSADLTSSA
jgi:hypothetical protein